jgi:hypothetical protein
VVHMIKAMLRIGLFLALGAGCAAQETRNEPAIRGIQAGELPRHDEFVSMVKCAQARGAPEEYAYYSEECIDASWTALRQMSADLSCRSDDDCYLYRSWPPVGPECAVSTRRWRDSAERARSEELVLRECGTVSVYGEGDCRVVCLVGRCAVTPAQTFPGASDAECSKR